VTGDPQLSEIVVKYRALIDAQARYKALQHEIAVLFNALDGPQKDAYIAAVERIDEEELWPRTC
jgi:hypothetical protein